MATKPKKLYSWWWFWNSCHWMQVGKFVFSPTLPGSNLGWRGLFLYRKLPLDQYCGWTEGNISICLSFLNQFIVFKVTCLADFLLLGKIFRGFGQFFPNPLVTLLPSSLWHMLLSILSSAWAVNGGIWRKQIVRSSAVLSSYKGRLKEHNSGRDCGKVAKERTHRYRIQDQWDR